MASGSNNLTSYKAKQIVGSSIAASPSGALLLTGEHYTGNTWLYHYGYGGTTNPWGIFHDTTAQKLIIKGSGTDSFWIKMNTGDTYVLGKMGIGYDPNTTGNNYKLYVDGSAYFDIGTDSTSDLDFVINGNNAYLSFSGQGIKSFTSANANNTLFLNYNGGQTQIGGSGYLVGSVGIGYDPDTNGNTYKLYVNGSTNITGTTTFGDYLYRVYTASDQTPMIWMNSSDFDNYLWQIGSGTANGKQYYGYGLKYTGTGSGVANYLQLIADNQNGTDVIAIGINQSGQIGLGANANTNYRLYVNGVSYFNGNTTHNGIDYFANGTTYYINNSADGYLNNLQLKTNLTFDATGTTGTSGKITWSGSTDAADIYYYVPASDQGNLIFNTRDDTNCLLAFAYNGTIKAYINNSTPSFYPQTTNTGTIGTSTYEWGNTYTRIIYARHFDASYPFTTDRNMYYGYNKCDNHYFYTMDGTTRTHRATLSSSLEVFTGNVWAGTNGSTAAERDCGARSGAGLIYLYSAAATNGNRGVYTTASPAGGGGARNLAYVTGAGRVYYADSYNGTATALAYSQSGLAGSAISWLTCWNGYELRAISKAETFNAVRDNGGDSRWVTLTTAQTITGTKSWGTSGAGGQLNGSATNGGINSIRIGDDVWLGDCNAGGIMGMKSTGSNCGFYFYNSGGTQIGQFYTNGTNFTCNKPIARAGVSRSWINGRDTAIIRTTSYSGYDAILSMKTTNGAWELGVYTSNICYFVYTPDTQYNAGTNSSYNNSVNIRPEGKIYAAVWNDYAEYRKDNQDEKDRQQPGRCVAELGDGSLTLSTTRLQRGCEIISDTFGFAIGENQEEGYNTPVAISGRVLAYPYESIEEFKNHIGYAVCSGPNGTVSIMTAEEEKEYPACIIGTISEIPAYTVWGTGKVKVNDRVWIRIR